MPKAFMLVKRRKQQQQQMEQQRLREQQRLQTSTATATSTTIIPPSPAFGEIPLYPVAVRTVTPEPSPVTSTPTHDEKDMDHQPAFKKQRLSADTEAESPGKIGSQSTNFPPTPSTPMNLSTEVCRSSFSVSTPANTQPTPIDYSLTSRHHPVVSTSPITPARYSPYPGICHVRDTVIRTAPDAVCPSHVPNHCLTPDTPSMKTEDKINSMSPRSDFSGMCQIFDILLPLGIFILCYCSLILCCILFVCQNILL